MELTSILPGSFLMVKWGDDDDSKSWRQAEVLECDGDEIIIGFENGDHQTLESREITVQNLVSSLRYFFKF